MVRTLDPRESQIVQKTWIEATNKLGNTSSFGVAALDRLFTNNPEYVQVFTRLRDIPAGELRGHVNFRAQGAKMANALQGIIESLDDPETEVLLHAKLENAHVPRNLKPEHYEEFQRAIVGVLQSTLGQGFTPFAKSSWDKALTGVMDGIHPQ